MTDQCAAQQQFEDTSPISGRADGGRCNDMTYRHLKPVPIAGAQVYRGHLLLFNTNICGVGSGRSRQGGDEWRTCWES